MVFISRIWWGTMGSSGESSSNILAIDSPATDSSYPKLIRFGWISTDLPKIISKTWWAGLREMFSYKNRLENPSDVHELRQGTSGPQILGAQRIERSFDTQFDIRFWHSIQGNGCQMNAKWMPNKCRNWAGGFSGLAGRDCRTSE